MDIRVREECLRVQNDYGSQIEHTSYFLEFAQRHEAQEAARFLQSTSSSHGYLEPWKLQQIAQTWPKLEKLLMLLDQAFVPVKTGDGKATLVSVKDFLDGQVNLEALDKVGTGEAVVG